MPPNSLAATKRDELIATLGEDRMYRVQNNPHQSTRAFSATAFCAPTLEVGFTCWGEALLGTRCLFDALNILAVPTCWRSVHV
jgi:hypothetical protein